MLPPARDYSVLNRRQKLPRSHQIKADALIRVCFLDSKFLRLKVGFQSLPKVCFLPPTADNPPLLRVQQHTKKKCLNNARHQGVDLEGCSKVFPSWSTRPSPSGKPGPSDQERPRCGLRLLVCACQPDAWVFLISCPLRAADMPPLL